MSSEDVQKVIRIVAYYIASSAVTYGAIDQSLTPVIAGLIITVLTALWTVYGMRITSKLTEIAKLAEKPDSPVVGVITSPDAKGHDLALSVPGPVVPSGTNGAVALATGVTSRPTRTYRFELPINVPFFYVRTVIERIVAAGLWDLLPAALTNRLVEANKDGTGLEITRADLDSIPDEVWSRALIVIQGG